MGRKEQTMEKIPCVYMRGGTSKAVFFHKEDLPTDERKWDEIFLKVEGSPDVKQIDGMGGTVSSTSKIAVISRSERPDADVDFSFYQVAVDAPQVIHNVSCGNIGSAVGSYAIDEGLVPAAGNDEITKVRIYNTNTKKYLENWVRTKDGHACMYGDCSIQGVPGTGSRVDEFFLEPAGSVTEKLFPTGNRQDTIALEDGRRILVTVIDSGNLVVLVKAESLEIAGTEQQELNDKRSVMDTLEELRGKVAQKLGMVSDWHDAKQDTPAAPDISIVSRPQDYKALDGSSVRQEAMDLCARAISMGKVHKAYPMTVAVATASAAFLPGTVANEICGIALLGKNILRLGHASGCMDVQTAVSGDKVEKVGVVRTARRIMDGFIYIR